MDRFFPGKNGKLLMTTNPRSKCVLVGDSFVGKTSLAQVFVSGFFRDYYAVSCGGSFMARTLKDPPLTMQLWDTAGMERFRAMLPHYLRDASCAIFVFDLTDRKTFISLRDFWVDYVKENVVEDEQLVMVMVGNKTDRVNRVVKELDARALAEHYGMEYFETSAKNKVNVQLLFESTAKKIMQVGAYTTTGKDPMDPKVLPSSPTKKQFKCCPS